MARSPKINTAGVKCELLTSEGGAALVIKGMDVVLRFRCQNHYDAMIIADALEIQLNHNYVQIELAPTGVKRG